MLSLSKHCPAFRGAVLRSESKSGPSTGSGQTEFGVKRYFACTSLLVALAACSPSKLAYGQVKSAMMDAGLSERNSACMATRMTDRLTLAQLQKLKQLRGEKRGLMDYVSAVRRVGDAEALEVTATSAALCATGIAPEKK